MTAAEIDKAVQCHGTVGEARRRFRMAAERVLNMELFHDDSTP
jgi:hypothetical protein